MCVPSPVKLYSSCCLSETFEEIISVPWCTWDSQILKSHLRSQSTDRDPRQPADSNDNADRAAAPPEPDAGVGARRPVHPEAADGDGDDRQDTGQPRPPHADRRAPGPDPPAGRGTVALAAAAAAQVPADGQGVGERTPAGGGAADDDVRHAPGQYAAASATGGGNSYWFPS